MSLLTQASLVVTPNANKSGKLYSVIPSNGNGDFTVTRATTATRTNSSGLIETTASGMVRRDYSLGSCPNLLLEPQRTNLIVRSEEFDNIAWTKSASTIITANSIISPSGVLNADTITQSGANTLLGQILTISTIGVYSYSSYIKKGNFDSSSFFRFGVYQGVAIGQITFDFSTGLTSVITGTFISHSATNVGNGWYRIQYTINIPTIGVTTFYNGGVGGNISNGAFFYSWGAQLEAGNYSTSYIPTTSASVTRNADQISLGNVYTNGLISASGGTWFLEIRNNLARVRDAGSYSLLLGDSTVALPNAFTIRSATAGVSSRLIIAKIVATVETNLYTTLTDTVKIAIKWNGTTADVFVNGTKVVSSTAYTPTTMQFIYANGNDIPKNINQMALFPTPLTDTQCTQLTTL